MDPSNFGSFSSGGNFGGTGATGTQNGGVASGTDTIAGPQQSAPVQAQGFVGTQATQPQMVAQLQAPGSMQFQPQVVSSSTEDVVLGGAGPKKSRRGVVVGVVIASVVLLSVLAVFVIGGMANINRERSGQKFNIFANYILYGEFDNSQSLEIGDDDQYTLRGIAFYDANRAKEFYPLAMQYWDAFKNTYSKQDEEINNKIADISDELIFLDKFANSGLISGSKLLEAYYYGGEDALMDEYSKYYSDFRQDSEVFQDFMIIQDAYVASAIQLLGLYSQEGCIVDAKEDTGCVEERQLMGNEYYDDVISVDRETFQYALNVETRLVNNVIELSTLIAEENGHEN
ncbi:MAG: hypothetical protein Q4C24_01265 [Candidatus Saccharibacteria bacterium]|nr:hypothetical protein [Candidatus Saccharibacteria bacterium]